MRIIGGEFGGRVIRTPGNLEVRPTTDLAKEALFNILSNRVDFYDLKVLDLFAGTGSIGMEFASREARQVICVEKDSRNANFIINASMSFGMKNLQVIRADVFRVLKSLGKDFDIVFADPPFLLPNLDSIPEKVIESGILKPDSTMILEHGPNHDFKHIPQFLELRKYGKVRFSFFSG